MCEGGFGHGESEYEVSFGLAPRNGELSPSVPKTPEPFISPFRIRNPERSSYSNSPQNLGSVGRKLGAGANIPRDKGSMVKLNFFLKMAKGEIKIFFLTCHVSVHPVFPQSPKKPSFISGCICTTRRYAFQVTFAIYFFLWD